MQGYRIASNCGMSIALHQRDNEAKTKGIAMKNIKELWMKYQMEKALQLIELNSVDEHDLRIKELEKQMKSKLLSADMQYDMGFSVVKPEA